MHRVRIRFALLVACATIFSGTAFSLTDAQEISSGVDMYRGNAARTGEVPGPGPDTIPALQWEVQLGEHFPTSTSAPAIVDDTIYFATGARLNLHPLGASFEGVPEPSQPPMIGYNSYTLETPHHVYALDSATGIVRWEFQLSGPAPGTPAVADGTVFVASVVYESWME